jgi:hypothetical protein
VCRRRTGPTVAELSRIEDAALHGAAPGTRLEVVLEPTGPAWLPVAVFFTGRGYAVYRVSSAKAADLRRFLSRHAKSNGIDADTLARLPLVDPAGLRPLQLPGVQTAALDRRVRATDRLTRAAAAHKVRIKDLVRQLLPATPLTGDLGQADLAVLARWADPRALLTAGPARLTTVISKASQGQQAPSGPRPGGLPPQKRSSSMRPIRRCRSPTWPPRSPPRSGCCARSRSNWPPTPRTASTPTAGCRHTASDVAVGTS